MANVVVVGTQWGDEGKGKIVDWLSERADVIARFQGGHNAGHTLVIGSKRGPYSGDQGQGKLLTCRGRAKLRFDANSSANPATGATQAR